MYSHWHFLFPGLSHHLKQKLCAHKTIKSPLTPPPKQGIWILSYAFSASIEMIVWFLSFNPLIWFTILIDFQMFNQSCILGGKNPTWSCCVVPFLWYVARFILLLFCWGFLHPRAISNPKRWCCESAALNRPAHLENSAVTTGLEKVSFHSNPKERQCQRMLKLPHNCTHLTR